MRTRHASWIALAALAAIVVAGGTSQAQSSAAAPSGQHGSPQHHMEHRFDDPARDAWQMPDRVIAALAIQPGQRVADIGAGTGYFSARLAKAVPSATVYAVDVEAAMVNHLRKRADDAGLKNLVPVLAAPDSPNLPQAVDLVLIVDTYHHLPNRTAYFRGLAQSLTPGARVAIIDFRKDSPEGPPVEFRFSAEQIEAEMRDAGYRLDQRHDFLPRQHFLIFTRADKSSK